MDKEKLKTKLRVFLESAVLTIILILVGNFVGKFLKVDWMMTSFSPYYTGDQIMPLIGIIDGLLNSLMYFIIATISILAYRRWRK